MTERACFWTADAALERKEDGLLILDSSGPQIFCSALTPDGTVTQGLCTADSLRASMPMDTGPGIFDINTSPKGGGEGKSKGGGAHTDCCVCTSAVAEAEAALCGVCEVEV